MALKGLTFVFTSEPLSEYFLKPKHQKVMSLDKNVNFYLKKSIYKLHLQCYQMYDAISYYCYVLYVFSIFPLRSNECRRREVRKARYGCRTCRGCRNENQITGLTYSCFYLVRFFLAFQHVFPFWSFVSFADTLPHDSAEFISRFQHCFIALL